MNEHLLLTAILLPLDGNTLALEKNHPGTPMVLAALLRVCRIEKNMDAIYQCRLSTFAVWNSLHRGVSIEAVLQTLAAASAYPLPDLFLNNLRREMTRGEIFLRGIPMLEKNPVSSESPDALTGFLQKNTTLKLRPAQTEALTSILQHLPALASGFLVLPGGSGKTLLGLLVSLILGKRTLFVLPNPLIRSQWQAELRKYNFKLPEGSSLVTDEDLNKPTFKLPGGSTGSQTKALPEVELLVADEVHSLGQTTAAKIRSLNIPVRIGLTASPDFPDQAAEDFFLAFGPVLYEAADLSLVPPLTYTEIKLELENEDRHTYLLGKNNLIRFRIASANPRKTGIVRQLLKRHSADKTVVLSEYLESLEMLAEELKLPFLTGKSPLGVRKKVYKDFNEGRTNVLLSSAVSDEGVDLPGADVLIQLSGKKDDSVQELQRLGRLLRPKNSPIRFYTLVTRNTLEEVSARTRRLFIESSGFPCVYNEERFDLQVSETEAESLET